MKRGWYKNQITGEVVFKCGSNDGQVFYRVRSGETKYERKPDFFAKYKPIKASGFPPLKPKEFKPRYAVYDHWSEGEAFVMEFEPGKFKVVMKDGREIFRDEATCKHFAEFFREGRWKIVSEAEAKARLDKPKPSMPAAEQFGPGPWYGAGLKYVYCQEGFYVYQCNHAPFFNHGVGWVSYEVVQHLWDLGMVSKERPISTESIAGKASAVLDVPKTAFTPKKVLVEWAFPKEVGVRYYTELWPEGASPAVAGQKCFKTGRTVEVPE